jgi:starvation-inducible DNA-binding protein
MSQSTRTKVTRSAAPLTGQRAHEMQAFGSVVPMPIALAEDTRRTSAENLNQLLADTMTLRDLYKKHHWQVSGPTFYQLHLLFDKHFNEQSELVDLIAERIMMLGGVSIAMSADVAETTLIPRPPAGREEVPVQISRLLHAHEIVLKEARDGPQSGRGGRRRHQRPAGQQRHPHQRDAGVVRRGARGRCPAGPRRRADGQLVRRM